MRITRGELVAALFFGPGDWRPSCVQPAMLPRSCVSR